MMKCWFMFYHDAMFQSAAVTMSCVESLLADMEQLLENTGSTDTVIMVQEQEIRCHKLILSARSGIFKK